MKDGSSDDAVENWIEPIKKDPTTCRKPKWTPKTHIENHNVVNGDVAKPHAKGSEAMQTEKSRSNESIDQELREQKRARG